MGLIRNTYKEWVISKHPNGPVTALWRARRWGVEMCHNTYDGLIEMIRQRNAEQWNNNEELR